MQEIERVFLVNELPESLLTSAKTLTLSQGYLVISEDSEVRVRQKNDSFVLTVKKGAGLVRTEVETSLSEQQFSELWPVSEGARVEKTRYHLHHDGRCIELDIFEGHLQGLVLAEVEFLSTDEAENFKPPTWFGVEVTEDSRYMNRNLARFGIPTLEADSRAFE